MSDEKSPKAKWVKSPLGVAEYYINSAVLMWSLDDVRVRLGQLVNAEDNSASVEDFKAVSQERAAVTMSWRNAKLLRNQLAQLIKLYEDTNGEINVDVKLPSEKVEVEKIN